MLSEIELAEMLNILDANCWSLEAAKASYKYEQYRRNKDLDSYNASSACQIRIPRTLEDRIPSYSRKRVPLAMKRIVIQLRLANNYCCNISFNKTTARFNPRQPCLFCNRQENESVEHIQFFCPIYDSLRNALPTENPFPTRACKCS